MFTDEELECLDPDILDVSISVLEHIQSKGNKSIGIIAHAGKFKKPILAKMKLQLTRTFYGNLQIVNE